MTDSPEPPPDETQPPRFEFRAKHRTPRPRFQFGIKHLLWFTLWWAGLWGFVALAGAVGAYVYLSASALLASVWFRLWHVAGLLLVAIPCWGVLLAPMVVNLGGINRRMECMSNLKQIALALHNYHYAYGCFPPAYVADETGRLMHSWRVLILPFIEQKALYDRYDFNEPWDGPNNSTLAKDIPTVYGCPSDTRRTKASTYTNYLAVAGPETAWPGAKPVKIADITDGTSRTILVVEVAGPGIHWMEPRDLDAATMAPVLNSNEVRGISSEHTGGANVALADGIVHFLSEERPSETLRALLTRSGGEAVDPDDPGP